MTGGLIRIIGVGNPLMSDDGLGIEVIRRLEKQSLPEGVELVDGGCGGLKLLPLLGGCRKLIIVDAADFGAEPGTHRLLTCSDLPLLPAALAPTSGHNLGLSELLLVAQKLKQLAPFELHLVQIESCQPGAGLSHAIESSLPKIQQIIIARAT